MLIPRGPFAVSDERSGAYTSELLTKVNEEFFQTWRVYLTKLGDLTDSRSLRSKTSPFVGHSPSPGWWTLEDERPVWKHAKVGTILELGKQRRIVDPTASELLT